MCAIFAYQKKVYHDSYIQLELSTNAKFPPPQKKRVGR